jgi:predicted  nucleic acid-binding Zn-ribbon protein
VAATRRELEAKTNELRDELALKIATARQQVAAEAEKSQLVKITLEHKAQAEIARIRLEASMLL